MFSQNIVASDAFLDMPTSSRELYFQLGMYADDDGFITPKRIMRVVGASDDDLKVLATKRFIIPFDTGVVVIKHWLIHNLLRADVYKETLHKKEKAQLGLNEAGSYTELRDGILPLPPKNEPTWLRKRRGEEDSTENGTQAAPRKDKSSEGKEKEECLIFGEFKNVNVTQEEMQKLINRYGRGAIKTLIEELSTYIKSKNVRYRDHYATLLTWARRKGIVENKPAETPTNANAPIVNPEEQKKVQTRMKEISSNFKMPA